MSVNQQKKLNTQESSPWESLGTVSRAHGLQGYFFLGGRRSPVENEYAGAPVRVCSEEGLLCHSVITAIKQVQQKSVILIEGLSDRSAVEIYRGCSIEVQPQNQDQRIGMKILDMESQEIGHVRAILDFGASEVVEVETPLSEQPVLIPYVEDYLVSKQVFHLQVPFDFFL
ncbi:MAG: ribosome maturation factor RimM [Oligoflexales bacterium]